MNYKVGDMPRVHTLEWFEKNANKDKEGSYKPTERTNNLFVSGMFKYCGKLLKIKTVYDGYYRVSDDNSYWFWEDWMFESTEEDNDLIRVEDVSSRNLNDKNFNEWKDTNKVIYNKLFDIIKSDTLIKAIFSCGYDFSRKEMQKVLISECTYGDLLECVDLEIRPKLKKEI